MGGLMHRSEPRHSLRQEGFTYLWFLLLVAMLLVGLSVAVELESTAGRRDREQQLIGVGKQFRNAIATYYELDGGGRKEYPASLEELLRDNRVPGLRRHLRQIFHDPMTGKADWALVTVGGRVVGVHSLSDKVPIKQAGFDAEEASFTDKQSYAEWVFAYPADLMMRTDGAAAPAPTAPGGRDVVPASRPSR